MLSRVNNNIRRYLHHPTLGAVNKKLVRLADMSRAVDQKWSNMVQKQGFALIIWVKFVENAWNKPGKDDIGRLQKNMEDVKRVLQSVHGDVTDLRGKTHLALNLAHGRAVELRTEVDNLQKDFESMDTDKQDIQTIIDDMNAELGTGNQARSEPMDGGPKLRESAERKRNSIAVLERVLATYEREQERLKKLLENKKQDLATFEGYEQALNSAFSDLNKFGNQLATTIKNMVHVEMGLISMCRSDNCGETFQCLLKHENVESLPILARKKYSNYASQWRNVRTFIGQMV